MLKSNKYISVKLFHNFATINKFPNNLCYEMDFNENYKVAKKSS